MECLQETRVRFGPPVVRRRRALRIFSRVYGNELKVSWLHTTSSPSATRRVPAGACSSNERSVQFRGLSSVVPSTEPCLGHFLESRPAFSAKSGYRQGSAYL